MDKKNKIILVLLIVALLSLSSYASLSRFSKGVNKEGSINTTEMEYCKLNEIDTLGECLIRNDSKQELSLALGTIDARTNNGSDQSGLYKNEDDYTINNSNYTYYYRGNVDNNWVKFGDYLWRVIRINGDGTIRMIYSGLESAPNHTGNNAQIGTTAYSRAKSFTNQVLDITGLTTDLITLNYSNGRHGLTYVGYMYNPAKRIISYPDGEVNNTNRVSSFPLFITNTVPHYFFKNFNPEEDCFTGDGTEDDGACTLKCRKLGNDGEGDNDCVYSSWDILSTTEGNYSTTSPGVYPENNPYYYVYQKSDTDGGYRYTCWVFGNPTTKENSDGTTSVYVSCPIVSEIVGTIKDQPTRSFVRYHGAFSANEEEANKNVLDSRVKQVIDTWYENNIYNIKDAKNNYLEDYLSDGIFCNDRTSPSTPFPFDSYNGYNYGAYERNYLNNNPSFKCLNTKGAFNVNDAFTLKTTGTNSIVESSGIGNNVLNYPIGLITMDEAVFAGGKHGTANDQYYLYTGATYWTMSRTSFSSYHQYAFTYTVSNTGNLYNYPVLATYGVRPVINLKSDILYKGGNGTENNPYIIDVNN